MKKTAGRLVQKSAPQLDNSTQKLNNSNLNNDLRPFPGFASFEILADSEISNLADWVSYLDRLGQNIMVVGVPPDCPYPCLVGVFWWHLEAKRAGISFGQIEKAMQLFGKTTRDIAARIGRLFEPAAPRINLIEIQRYRFSPRNYWCYALAICHLAAPFLRITETKKKKGRELGDRVLANSLSRRKLTSSRVKEYALEAGKTLTKEQCDFLALGMERIIRSLTIRVVEESRSPILAESSDDEKLEHSFSNLCGTIFNAHDPEEYIQRCFNQRLLGVERSLVSAFKIKIQRLHPSLLEAE
jgi:hypothetical protein